MMFRLGRFGFSLAFIALPCLPTEIPTSAAHGSLPPFRMALHDATDLSANWATSGNSYRPLSPHVHHSPANPYRLIPK
jgi:hypothetical protein